MTRRAAGSEQNIGDAYNTFGKVYLEFDETAYGPNVPVWLVFELNPGSSVNVFFRDVVVGGVTVTTQQLVTGTTHFSIVNIPPGEISYSFNCPWGTGTTYYSGSGTVTCRPSGLKVSLIETYPDGAKFNASIDTYGYPNYHSDRYIEADILSENDFGSLGRKGKAEGVLQADITVTNNPPSYGELTVQPNTQYYYGMYATNTPGDTAAHAWTVAQDRIVTTPYAPTVTLTDSTYNSATFSYSTQADGGFYPKTLQYSLDNGSTWNTYATVSSGSATSGSFTISGLSPNTTYTVKTRVSTTAGITNGQDVIVTTIGSNVPIVSITSKTNNSIEITYKETSFNSPSGRKLELYGGTTPTPTTLLETQSSPVENLNYVYSHTGLVSNGVYFYRAVAYADFDNVSVPVSSDDVIAYTLPATPLIDGVRWDRYVTNLTQEFYIELTIPSSGGALQQAIQYRTYLNGNYSNWTTLTTVSGSSQRAYSGFIQIPNTTAQELHGLFQVRALTSDGESGIAEANITVKPASAPEVSEWSFIDANPTTVGVTGNNTIFIQGYSTPELSVEESDITLPDNTYITEITGSFAGSVNTLDYVSGVYSTTFDNSNSGTYTGELYIKDSLGGEFFGNVSRIVLPYIEPTITGTFNYVSEDGKIGISIAGEYSPLVIDDIDKNTLTVSYKVTEDEVLVDWTEVPYSTSGDDFTAYVNNVPTTYHGTYLVEVKVVDALGNESVYSFEVSSLEKNRFLSTPQYDIEVWTREGEFIADITKYITSELSITWKLNDIEELSFSVSLDKLELMYQERLSIVDLLTPYAHDIRVRRNGNYIVGCQIVEANIRIDNEQIPTVQVKATGFLNIFKDQYISEPMAGYTYPEMAHKLINRAQHADCLIKNPTGDIDASYWLSDTSSIAQTTIGYAGNGAIQAVSSNSPTTMGTQMSVQAGTPISLSAWVSGTTGTVYVYERELINQSSNQVLIGSVELTSTDVYTHLTVDSYVTHFENGYIYFSKDQSNTPLRVDNCFVSRADDEDELNNHYVGSIYTGLDDTTGGTGHNYADVGYTNREFNYELQNVKDAIMDLTQMGEDYFEFEFTPDRIFNTYERKGSDRTDIEVYYPGNVQSLTVDRSAADMANKIQEIGSGIGDERLEVIVSDLDSRRLYGTREGVTTQNNVSLTETLQGLAQGELDNRGGIIPKVSVTIQDGSINGGNIQTGDVIAVRIGEYLGVLGQQQTPEMKIHLELFGDVEGWYRVEQIQARISQDGMETITLQLKWLGGFEES